MTRAHGSSCLTWLLLALLSAELNCSDVGLNDSMLNILADKPSQVHSLKEK